MQLVPEKFYIWFNRGAAVHGGCLLLLTLLSYTLAGAESLQNTWGVTPLTGIIGLLQVVYGLVFFNRQRDIRMGSLIAAMIFTVNTLGLINGSGQLHSWWLILWAFQVFVSGIFGLYALVGSGFLITMYYVLVTTGNGQYNPDDPVAIGVVLATYVLIAISYFAWKRLYVATESSRISQLTGQLSGKQQQAEILIQAIADGIIVTDTEGKISLLNSAAANLTGWPINEALGIAIRQVAKLAQEDGKEFENVLHPFDQVLQTNKEYSDILMIKDRQAKKGTIVSLIISPITLPKNNELIGCVGVFRDISAEREEEHRRADFISTASHEMRTPVAAIEGYLALALNEKVSKIDVKARDFLLKAHESSQRLGQLFQDLLTSAKAEDGRLVNHPVVVEIGAYLEQLTDGLRFAAEKKGLLMDFAIGATNDKPTESGGKMVKPLYYALIDPDRMREVITNLFDNAVKYTETGKISIGLTGNNEVIQFFIRDTGHGIPPEDVPHLFQKFYRVDNTSTRTIGGTGLGLFICRKIVELYSGRIWVESEINKGSTFYINLPRLSNDKAAELQKAAAQSLG
jgi:two-component system, OmpR family, sensor histidine kinase VicK